ncbi:MAG: hypothetical protein IKE40_04065 [Firmicutes bacterium]|nr:hypothetical protein [Bacillota bacterium]
METKKRGITRWLIPGLIFQSVTIGGGYGTGAEIAQYFGASGYVGGLLSAVVTLVIWAVMCAVTFEFVRVFKTYDYGSMMGKLLGKAGILYDILYYIMMFIVLGVLNATAGSMMSALTGTSKWLGVAILSVGVIYLVFKGTVMIERVLSFWSYVLYAVYIVFMIVVFVKFGSNISAEFAKGEINSSWFSNGCSYALYNLVVVPLILYTVRDCDTRKEAVGSGLLAGLLGVIPGVLLLLTMGADFAAVQGAETPVTVLFDMLDMKWLYIIFEIVLFGTLIETGTGFIKAVADRLEAAAVRHGKELPKWGHPLIVVGMVLIGVLISIFGLLNLIVKGYGTSVWGFLIIYAIPMLTLGVYKIAKATKKS